MIAYEGDKEFVFVSYSHRDSRTVLPIIDKLQDAGFRVWFDEGIEAGSEWTEYIADHLDRSRCFVAFLSRSSSVSPNCRREIHRAIKLQKNTLIVYLEDIQLSPGMEMELDVLQALYRSNFADEEAFFAALASAKLLQPCREAGAGAARARHAATKPRPLPREYPFDRGYLDPAFAAGTNGILDLECPRILMADRIISGAADAKLILNAAKRQPSPWLVIARDYDAEAFDTLVKLGVRKGISICAVKAPGYGDRRKALLGDIAAVTGGAFLDEDQDLGLLRVADRMLGRAELVRVTEDATCIYGGFGSEHAIGERIAQIDRALAETWSDFDREKLGERKALLMGQKA